MENLTGHENHWNLVAKLHAPFQGGVEHERTESDQENPDVKHDESGRDTGFVSVICAIYGDHHEKQI